MLSTFNNFKRKPRFFWVVSYVRVFRDTAFYNIGLTCLSSAIIHNISMGKVILQSEFLLNFETS